MKLIHTRQTKTEFSVGAFWNLWKYCNFSTTTTTTASTGCAEDDYSCEDYVAEDHYKDWYPDKSEYDFEDYDGEYDDEYTATITNTTTSPITTNTRVPK